MINPFIVHEGKVYLIEGWSSKLKGDKPMRIRPLTPDELEIWRAYWDDFGYETYAQIVPKPGKSSKAR